MTIKDDADSGASILVAGENAAQAQRLTGIFAAQGYRVSIAANGKVALEMVRRQMPDLVISDATLPEMNGYEMCKRIKVDPQLHDVRVILVTTLTDAQDLIQSLECRADYLILEPCDSDSLLRRVRLALAGSRPHHIEQSDKGLEIDLRGHKYLIAADPAQILDLLLATCETAIERNRQLQQFTLESDERVKIRTRELEQSNQALRQGQNALIQQERLRALGQMASGLAHDINNAISPIALYTEAILER